MAHNQEKLTGVTLNGKNYHLWAKQVMFSLSSREWLEYIIGEKPKPVPKNSEAPTDDGKKATS